MDFLTLLVLLAVFLFVVSLFSVLYLGWSESRYVQKRNLRRRLLNISAGGGRGLEKLSLYKKEALKDADFFERLAYSLPRISVLDRKLVKVRFPLNASSFLLMSAALGGIGLLLGFRFMPTRIGAIVPALILLFLPYLLLCRAEKNYLAQFETQLPETLDFLARALRSGHALSAGFELVSTEMPEPTRAEFAATVDEVNLGLSFREAFENMCARINSRDLRIFAVALLVQRDTGGNVAEILDNIGHVIRERVKFKRDVSSLTAEGRLSGWILFLLPIGLFAYLYVISYDYVSLLWTDPIGVIMLTGGIIAMFIGAFVIKQIVSIDM